MKDERKKNIVNYILFQAGWFACVLGGNTMAIYSTMVILTVHLIWIGNWKKEKEILAVTLLLGSTIDSFLGNLQILQFSEDSRLLPAWMACLWCLFGTTLRHSFLWAINNKRSGALIGMLFGPLSYLAASKLTDISLAHPLWQSVAILSILWALIIPVLQAFSGAWIERTKNQVS